MSSNNSKDLQNPYIVIRSTILPDTINLCRVKYSLSHLAHVPEFLREKTALQDIFNTERIIVGTLDNKLRLMLHSIFRDTNVPVVLCRPEESSLIKLTANAWLATQISFWNEMSLLYDKYNVDPQRISNAVTLDSRISSYGANLIQRPYAGFCFPKDTKALKKLFYDHKIIPHVLLSVITLNEIVEELCNHSSQ